MHYGPVLNVDSMELVTGVCLGHGTFIKELYSVRTEYRELIFMYKLCFRTSILRFAVVLF